MRIEGFIWLEDVEDKILQKHRVEPREAEEVLSRRPRFFFVEEGDRPDEDMFVAMGQSIAGRYLAVYFIYKTTREALIISVRDMTTKERRRYGRK